MKALHLCLLFLTLSQILSLSTRNHLNTFEDKQNYLNALLQLQSQIASDTQRLKNFVEEVNEKTENYDYYETSQGEALRDGLNEQRNLIYDIQNKLILPLDKKTWECKNIQREEADLIKTQIGQTQKKIYELESKMEEQGQCQRNAAIQSQIQYLKMYLNHLVSEMSNVCGQSSVPVFRVPKKDSNFIYGSLTQDQYKQNVIQKTNQGYITMECSAKHPYPSNENCISCEEGQVFDLSLGQCTQCQDYYKYDKDSHQCITEVLNSNPDGQNYYGQKPPYSSDSDQCPSYRPFFNGNSCVKCQLPRYFSYESKACETCEPELAFDVASKTCGYQKFNSNLGPLMNYCCEGQQKQINSDYHTCPQEKPFFNGKQCISCSLPSYFGLIQGKCKFCPDGLQFSLKRKKCVDSSTLKPIFISDVQNNQNYKGTPHVIPQGYENVYDCPQDKPFYNQERCVACHQPHYFNFYSNKCEVCNPDSKFNLFDRECQFISTEDVYNNNMVSLKNYRGSIPEYDSQLPTCPSDFPLFDGNTCIECNLPRYADLDTKTCKQCPSARRFNTFNRQCEYKYQEYYTDINAENIYYNGDFKDVEHQIHKKKLRNPSISKCDEDSPFYNALDNQCMRCNEEYPLFDFKYNRCIRCNEKATYSNDRHICIPDQPVNPTVERMIMNTIGFL